MTRPLLAIMLAACTTAAQAQQAVSIQPSVDSAKQRLELRGLIGCVAKVRQNWARQLLAQPYLSDAQSRNAGEAFEGKDGCLPKDEMEVTFRTSSIVSNLAEHFLRSELANVDQERLERTLNSLTPLNASEDFALCVAARAPGLARELSLSEPGSTKETTVAQQLAPYVPSCAAKDEKLTVDLQGLRGLMSIALYRAVTTVRQVSN